MTQIRVIAASANQAFITKMSRSLPVDEIEVIGAVSLEEIQNHLNLANNYIVLLHYDFHEKNGLEILEEIQAWENDIPVICITPSGDVDYAVQSLQKGAVNYVVEWGDYPRKLPGFIKKAQYYQQLKIAYENAQETVHSQALLLNYVQDAVVAWDTDLKITYCNYAARKIFGLKTKDCLGKSAEEYYFTLFEPRVELATELGTREFRQERKLLQPNDQEIWVNSRVSYIYDPMDPQKIIGYMDISRDITERKRIDEQVKIAQEEMVQSRRLAELGELASGVAHQINNPLATIIAESQIVKRLIVPDHPAFDSIQAIEEAGWKAQQAVSSLLEYTRKPKSTHQILFVNDTIQVAVSLIQKNRPELAKNIELHLARGLPEIRGNPHQLEDLWVKLITGKRIPEDSVSNQLTRIRTSAEGKGGVLIEVEKESGQLTREQLELFFEPDYYQDQEGPGSGLSFSICREIVRQHHGQIKVVNLQSNGTCIQVLLPEGENIWNQPIF